MTKKELHSKINKAFYTFVTEQFPEYEIDPTEGYGRVDIYKKDKLPTSKFGIEYHQSRHDLCLMNDVDNKVKQDAFEMECFLKKLVV